MEPSQPAGVWLQLGHDRLIVERAINGVLGVAALVASIGPRSFDRGKNPEELHRLRELAELQLGHDRLIVERRMIEQLAEIVVELQLGHDRLIVESPFRPLILGRCAPASIGPRSFDRGKYLKVEGRLSTKHMLQLGHDRLIVESVVMYAA